MRKEAAFSVQMDGKRGKPSCCCCCCTNTNSLIYRPAKRERESQSPLKTISTKRGDCFCLLVVVFDELAWRHIFEWDYARRRLIRFTTSPFGWEMKCSTINEREVDFREGRLLRFATKRNATQLGSGSFIYHSLLHSMAQQLFKSKGRRSFGCWSLIIVLRMGTENISRCDE